MAHSELPENWQALLAKAREGCPRALGQLLEPHRQWLFGEADRDLASDLKAKDGASDLVQQTYLEAVRGFAAFRGNTPEEFRGWLNAIFGARLADYVRRYRLGSKRQVSREVPLGADQSGVEQPVQLLARDGTPRSQAAQNEEAQILEQALASLDPRDTQILRWRNHDHLPFAEIGQRLEISTEAARKAWVRALQRLRQTLHRHNAKHLPIAPANAPPPQNSGG